VERATARLDKRSFINKRITLDGQTAWFIKVRLAMLLPHILHSKPSITAEAKLYKGMSFF
jgi:hypothetical protein